MTRIRSGGFSESGQFGGMQGSIYEFRVYRGQMATGDIANTLTELRDKWFVPLSLFYSWDARVKGCILDENNTPVDTDGDPGIHR